MTILTAPSLAQVVRDMVAASTSAEIKTILSITEGGEPWTRIGLAADLVNATITFNDVPGWSSTVAANTNFCIEVEAILVAGAAATNLPRFGFNWNAALAHGVAEIEYHSAATAKVFANFANLSAAGNAQSAVGTAIGLNQPYALWAKMRGRTGAGAVIFKGQLAAESAASNAAILKVGSEYRTRIVS